MKLRRILCLATAVFLSGTGVCSADNRVIVSSGSTKGCAIKGIVKITFEPPKTVQVFIEKSPPPNGIVEPSPIEDLKRQAAALGANRIVFRDSVSEGMRGYGQRTGASAKWESTTLIAEALKC
jgi:hypothetical protein